jgi:hypothetical protein
MIVEPVRRGSATALRAHIQICEYERWQSTTWESTAMVGLRELVAGNAAMVLAVGGFLIGAVFGAIVFRTNFCTMGSISDIVNLGDWRRFRAWLLAIATAIVGVQWLQHIGVVPLGKSMYLSANLNWVGNILGGLMFGFGMVFAGGCASRNLARVGGGDLRSLFVLVVLGLFGYMTIGGVLGPARAALEQATAVNLGLADQSLTSIAGAALRLNAATAGFMTTAIVVGILLAASLMDESFRSSPVDIIAGIGVGICVVAGWALTGLAFDELAERPVQPISLTYVRPTGDTLEWLQRYTALGWPGFGVASVFGAVFGAFVAAKAMGRFKLTTFSDKGDTIRSLMGAALMGTGGVLALGCTVGQGITGLSTLALGSFITFAGLVIGGVWGMKMLERWILAEA